MGVLLTVMMALSTRCARIQCLVRASTFPVQVCGLQSSSITAKTSTSPPPLSALAKGLTGLNPRAWPTTQNANEEGPLARTDREPMRAKKDDSTNEAACALVVLIQGDEKLWL